MSSVPAALSRRSQLLVLVAMTAANGMVLVDQTAVPLTLADIMRTFGVGSQAVQWVLNASLLSLAGLLVLGGKLGDLFGRRRVFILGSVIFAGASACAGLAPDFDVLVAFRVLQGAGGALMLPTTVAIVSATFSGRDAGSALGTMGGAAAVAGAAGPVIGGGLTSVFGWRAVLLINVPLALLAVVMALRTVPSDARGSGERPPVDLLGSALLCLGLVSLVVGLGQTQTSDGLTLDVVVPLGLSVAALVAFVVVERKVSRAPLLDFGLLRRYPNYRGAVFSQGVAGMAEMGLGIIFPLLLILNLGMPPGLAGLALLPATLPMIVVAPLVGRWYDRVGGRWPMVTGFALLGLSGVVLAVGAFVSNYLVILPGLLVYGVGLSIVLTVNDPVSLDSLPSPTHGEASGVSATAEQFGGALGIAVLYSVFHFNYVRELNAGVQRLGLSDDQLAVLKDRLLAAESTGLHPSSFDSTLFPYLLAARRASEYGYAITFVAVAVLGVIGLLLALRLVRKVEQPAGDE